MAKCFFNLLLILSLTSCFKDKKQNMNDESKCDSITQSDFDKFCAAYSLEVEANRSISEKSMYYIWKKYGVILHWSIDSDELSHDTCMIKKSQEFYNRKMGINTISRIYSDIDSLYALENKKNSDIDFDKYNKYELKYKDGKYSYYLIILRNWRLKKDTINCQPLPKKDSVYQKVFDDLWNIYRKERVKENLIYYWYVIDKKGKLNEIEIMNQNCPDTVKQNIFNHLKKIEWYPARFKGDAVDYRGFDFF